MIQVLLENMTFKLADFAEIVEWTQIVGSSFTDKVKIMNTGIM